MVPVSKPAPDAPGLAQIQELDAARLAEFPILHGVSLAVRTDLLRDAQLRHASKGDLLIRVGAPNRSMSFIVSGRLGIHLDSVDGEPVAVLGAGETVGELSLLDGSAASANVVAEEQTILLEVGESAFWALVNASHAFAVNLLGKLAERLRTNNAAVSKSVQQRRAYEKVAMFDGLTGIHNRRWLDETLGRLLRRREHGGGTLSLALLDIDYFKKFNDQHGHEAGDHVLVLVAETVAGNLRPTDMFARFGGEEFVILFPETDLDSAKIATERVRAVVERIDTRMKPRDLPKVTVSMGVAELAVGQSAAELLKTADLALYQAKQNGRNRVELGRDPVFTPKRETE